MIVCVILCGERLRDFCVWRGCMIFIGLHDFSHSLTQVAGLIFSVGYVIFLCGEVA